MSSVAIQRTATPDRADTVGTWTSASRWAGLAGAAFGISVAAQNIWSGATGIRPSLDAPAERILERLVTNADAYTLLFAWVGVNIPLLIAFLGGAYARLRASAPELSAIGLVGGLLVSVFFPISTASLVAMAIQGPRLSNSLTLVDLLWDMHMAAFAFASLSLGMAIIGLSLAAVAARLVPSWFRVVGPAGGLVMIASAIPIKAVAEGVPATMIGLLGFLVWIVFLVVLGTRMWREKQEAAAGAWN
jgi:hypothetical protein